MGSGANRRAGLGPAARCGDASFEDLTVVSIGSTLKRLGGAEDMLGGNVGFWVCPVFELDQAYESAA